MLSVMQDTVQLIFSLHKKAGEVFVKLYTYFRRPT